MKKQVSIGFDLGITSVGWSIVEVDTMSIVDAGSRLFEEVGSSDGGRAADRRKMRSSRRMLRRRNLRKNDLIQLYINSGYINNKEDFYNLNFDFDFLEKREEAANGVIARSELLIILFNYLKHRGSFNMVDDLNELKKESANNKLLSEKEIAENKINDEIKKIQVPLEKHKLLAENFNKFRGINNEISLISHKDYEIEINKILDLHVDANIISNDFKVEYLNIYNRKREYYEGPGLANKKTGEKSKFGWEKGDFFDRLVGKDTYDRTENRSVKHCFTAYLFNFLNDVINLKIRKISNPITSAQKQELIEMALGTTKNKNSKITLRKLSKFFGVEDDDVSGYRITGKKGNFDFTDFELYNDIRKKFAKAKFKTDWICLKNYELLDNIGDIIGKCQGYDERVEELKKIMSQFSNEEINLLAEIKKSGSHSLSIKTMKKCIDIMKVENKNQMQIFSELGMKPDYRIKFTPVSLKNFKTIPLMRKTINEMYVAPVVKRALIQAIKVLKEIEHNYCAENREYEIEYISIEMARDSNTLDQKKKIEENQKQNRENNQKINDLYSSPNRVLNNKRIEKLKLLSEQDGKCLYSGKTIDIDRLIKESNYCEIDHIIPISISFDNSKANKVLVLYDKNQDKKQTTPFQYLDDNSYNRFKARACEMCAKIAETDKRYARNKLTNLLNEEDIFDPKSQLGFVSRNLNDTRYATTEVKAYVSEFKKVVKKNWKIFTINGRYTNYLRSKLKNLGRKDRTQFKHHAIDATLIAMAPLLKVSKNERVYDALSLKESDNVKLIEGQSEIKSFEELNPLFLKQGSNISNFNYKITKKVNKKVNTIVSNDTIYSLRKDENDTYRAIGKIDIFSAKEDVLKDIFITNKIVPFIKNDDEKTFRYLKNIYDEFQGIEYVLENNETTNVKNAFLYAREILGIKIVKQSNEKNPPYIKTLRYLNQKMEKFLDITHKFKNIKKNKKIVLSSFKPIAWDIWRSKVTGKYGVVSINAECIKFGKIDDAKDIDKHLILGKYEDKKVLNKIDNNYEFKFRLFKYDEVEYVFKNETHNKMLIVGQTGSLIEFKNLEYSAQENEDGSPDVSENKRIRLSVFKLENFRKVTTNAIRTKIKKNS